MDCQEVFSRGRLTGAATDHTHTHTHRALQLQESGFKSCLAFQRSVLFNSELDQTLNSLKSISLYTQNTILQACVNIYILIPRPSRGLEESDNSVFGKTVFSKLLMGWGEQDR
jgi:hypothetical protein